MTNEGGTLNLDAHKLASFKKEEARRGQHQYFEIGFGFKLHYITQHVNKRYMIATTWKSSMHYKTNT